MFNYRNMEMIIIKGRIRIKKLQNGALSCFYSSLCGFSAPGYAILTSYEL